MVILDTPEYYRIIVNAFVQSSKHEKVPFNPNIINRIINNYEYLKLNNIKNPINFYNLIYLEMEYQEKSGFILSDFTKELIKNYRNENKTTFMMYCAEMAYLQIARQIPYNIKDIEN